MHWKQKAARVKSIIDPAIAADRNLSASEEREVRTLMDEIKVEKAAEEAAAKSRNSDRAGWVKALQDMGLEPAFPGTGMSRKAPGPWGEAVLKSVGGEFGYKALVPTGTVTVPSLSGTIAANPDRPQSLLNLIPSEPLTGGDAFAYLKETVRTFNAAPVAAGGLKPTSVLSVAKVEDRARVIAHLSEPIPRSTLSDAPMLQQYVDGSMRQGVVLALENEVLNADGTGERFVGLNSTSGIQTQAFSTSKLQTLRKCITLLELVNLEASGMVMSPASWESIELLLTNEATYTLAEPGAQLPIDRARRRLWGVPVAVSSLVAANVAFVADFAGSTQLYEREGVQVDWSENVTRAGVTDFTVNQISFRAEGRWGFAVLRPSGVVKAALV